MFDLKKLKDNNAIFWIFRFPDIREVAAKCGWAVGIHGSVVHDLDLMAMPWVENHVSADELAEKLARAVVSEGCYREPEKSKSGDKPNGRIVYTIFAGDTYIDMNVIEDNTGTEELHQLHFMSWDEIEDYKTQKTIRAIAPCDAQGYFHAAINAMRDGDMGEKDEDGVYSRIWWGDYIGNSSVQNVRYASRVEVELFLKHYPLEKLAEEYKEHHNEQFVGIVHGSNSTFIVYRNLPKVDKEQKDLIDYKL